MTNTLQGQISRREFMRLGVSLTAGCALPPLLAGCVGDGDASAPRQTFVQPQVLQSVGGMLDLSLTVSYLKTSIGTADPASKQDVFLRAYGLTGSVPAISAPTLIVNGGDMLRIRLVNQLPLNPNPNPSNPSYLGYPNNTNLHVHGVHVDPKILDPAIPLYGDYVVDALGQGVPPGGSRQHQYRIPQDHPAGPFWYHPHLHGSSAIQVASCMAGALMIRGEIDRIPAMAAATELIFMFQSPYYASSGNPQPGVANGQLESFSQVANNPANGAPVLINGIRRPRLVMQSGEVQRWRFINTQIFNPLLLSLDDHHLLQYTVDGYPQSAYNDIPPGKGLKLDAGGRGSVLVKAGNAGTYYLRTLSVNVSTQGNIAEDILAEIVVIGAPIFMAIPPQPLPVSKALDPITDEELAAHGGMKRNIIFRAISNALLDPTLPQSAQKNAPITQAPASNLVSPNDELKEWIYNTDSTSVMNTAFTIGAVSTAASANPPAPGATTSPGKYFPFQSVRSMTQTVPLNSVEEWTIYNMNSVGHPFHIHVNPIYVIKINGAAVQPFWCDTLALPNGGSPAKPTSITFRSRFSDYTGLFVMHCHMLAHEDMGMMQAISVTA